MSDWQALITWQKGLLCKHILTWESSVETYIEVFGVDFAVLRQIEVLLCHKNTLCSVLLSADATKLCIFFFFLKKKEKKKKFPMLTTKEVFVDLLAVSFGNKPAAVTGKPCTQHIFYAEIKTYMIASSCCYSGNRFNQC